MFIAFFFSCWFPQSNLELWFRGHAVPDDLPHLLIFFFTFAKFIPRLACEFVECFQCAFGFFSALNISEDVVNRFLWNLFFSYFLSLFFPLKDLYQRMDGQKGVNRRWFIASYRFVWLLLTRLFLPQASQTMALYGKFEAHQIVQIFV